MIEMTPLDVAHAAMEAQPDNDAARLRFYDRLADAELFLLLAREAEGDRIEPEVFEIADAAFVLGFDREARLTAFTGRSSPYAAMSGRAAAGLLASGGLGLGLNLEVAPSSFLLPPSGVEWFAETLADPPEEVEQNLKRVFAPAGLPEEVLLGLDAKLASAAGLAESAYLVGVEYENGVRSTLLCFVDALPKAESALASAVSEVLRFSGLEAAVVDVGFFRSSDPAAVWLAKEGLRFELPKLAAPEQMRAAPGSDPDKPPILK
jgi:hypothetical protein